MLVDGKGVHLKKGQEYSRFELGSTVVLVFEVDQSKEKFEFTVTPHQKIKLGQKIGVLTSANSPNQSTKSWW